MAKLGIGVPSTTEQFYVKRTDVGPLATFIGKAHSSGDSASRVRIKDSDSTVDWFLSAYDDGHFALQQGGLGDRMAFYSNGNVRVNNGQLEVSNNNGDNKVFINAYTGEARVSSTSPTLRINAETGAARNTEVWDGGGAAILKVYGVTKQVCINDHCTTGAGLENIGGGQSGVQGFEFLKCGVGSVANYGYSPCPLGGFQNGYYTLTCSSGKYAISSTCFYRTAADRPWIRSFFDTSKISLSQSAPCASPFFGYDVMITLICA